MTTPRTRPSLPPRIAYYLRHLLAGRFQVRRFRVLPESGEIPPRHDEPLMLPKGTLIIVDSSVPAVILTRESQTDSKRSKKER